MGRKSTIPEIEERIKEPLGDYLRKQIHLFKKPQEIADGLGVSLSKTYEFMGVYDLKGLLKEKSREKPAETPGGELKEAIDKFLQAKTVGERSGETIIGYKNSLYNFLWYLDHKGINPSLTAFHHMNLQDFMYYLRSEKERFGGKTSEVAQASTLLSYYKKLRTLGYWMVKQEIIAPPNPVLKVETPQVPKRLPEDLPDEDIQKLLNSFGAGFSELRNKTIVMVFLDTGVRLGGMASMKLDGIDLITGWGTVIEKGNKQRKIKISSKCLEQLNSYVEERNRIAKTKALWVNIDGTTMSKEGIGTMVGALNERKLSDHRIHAHLFRHVWAKHMAEAGVSLMALQIMGGWDTISLVQMYASAYSTERAWAEHEAASPITAVMK